MIRPIRSEADYSASIMRLEELMSEEITGEEADELDILATLIESYETKHFPVDLPSPVEAIRFRMEQAELQPRDLEPLIGSRSRVSEVLSGARPLTVEMIRALSQHLRIPADALIRPAAEPKNVKLQEPAVAVKNQLSRWGVLKKGETFHEFISRACGGQPAAALLRKTRTERTAKIDETALHAWCATVTIRSFKCKVEPNFCASSLSMDVLRNLATVSRKANGVAMVRHELSRVGIAFVVLRHLPGTHLDGAALRRPDGTPIVALTLRHDRIDNFWFTLMHELAHVWKHLSDGTVAIFDDLELNVVNDTEKEADKIAQSSLIPNDLWLTFDSGPDATLEEVKILAKKAKVHPAIVAGRWQRENKDYRKFSKILGRGEVRSHFVDWDA